MADSCMICTSWTDTLYPRWKVRVEDGKNENYKVEERTKDYGLNATSTCLRILLIQNNQNFDNTRFNAQNNLSLPLPNSISTEDNYLRATLTKRYLLVDYKITERQQNLSETVVSSVTLHKLTESSLSKKPNFSLQVLETNCLLFHNLANSDTVHHRPIVSLPDANSSYYSCPFACATAENHTRPRSLPTLRTKYLR